MLDRPESEYRDRKWIVEFKRYPKSSGKSLEDITTPPTGAPDPRRRVSVDAIQSDPRRRLVTPVTSFATSIESI